MKSLIQNYFVLSQDCHPKHIYWELRIPCKCVKQHAPPLHREVDFSKNISPWKVGPGSKDLCSWVHELKGVLKM